MPVLALTAKKLKPYSFSRFITFCAYADGSFCKSALFPNSTLGTVGSSTSFTCSTQYSKPFRDWSSANENTTKIPSDPLKKFLAIDRYRSWPEVSHNSTSTSSP